MEQTERQLVSLLSEITPLYDVPMREAKARQDALAKPPGSLGLLSVTELAFGPTGSPSAGFGVVELVAVIALGLLVGSVLARSLRTAIHR